ncbi:hypothetical protein psal_cds_18 [Pandoravirus salinus]|uniref:DUF5902 domain-containing protein n=1 Tax=Pandoravirus salinus TaxID=1349410 RepID=S4VSV0_9VIRU|nr:hypothetical protein psal_cds_18 [Pandoravirus salinus]AGO83383.1 hypothetical protein psal_cds_18 [Pandoravirus salinus]
MTSTTTASPSITALPLELVALVAAHIQPDDLLAFCTANSLLLSACEAEVVEWRQRAPEIEIVLPPRMSARQFLSPLAVAWYRSALNVLDRKHALYAIRMRIKQMWSFQTLMATVSACQQHLAGATGGSVRAIPDNDNDERGGQSFLVDKLSDIETWAREQPRLAGFFLADPWLATVGPVEIIGPLGPRAALIADPPALLGVLGSAWATGQVTDLVIAARDQAFGARARAKINKALNKTLNNIHGSRADKRQKMANLINLMYPATPADRETLDTRGGHRPLDIRTRMDCFCEDVDLWRAYPAAEIYLVYANGRWAAGVALHLPDKKIGK